jgi:dolichol-phosphate mannosyltransferase
MPQSRVMNRWTRFVVFNAVGALGVGVQLMSLWLLTSVAAVHYMIATPVAVMLAVVHNFVWHYLCTWKDRDVHLTRACARFIFTNGLLSIASNLGVTAALVSGTHAHPVVANAVAIVTSGLLNFWLGDVVAFR